MDSSFRQRNHFFHVKIKLYHLKTVCDQETIACKFDVILQFDDAIE
jgi:hypothetical protein